MHRPAPGVARLIGKPLCRRQRTSHRNFLHTQTVSTARGIAMEHIAALLLILGCSDDLAECQELPAPVAVFETAEECDAVVHGTLRSFTHQFPQILAKCIAVDPALEEEDLELVWDIEPDGTLQASVEIPEVMVAEGGKGDRLLGNRE
jgi:hypothetical protein